MLIVLFALAGCGSCGGDHAAPVVTPLPVVKPAAPTPAQPNPMTDMPDMGAPPVPLDGRLVTIEATDAVGTPTLSVTETGQVLELTVAGSPICGGEGMKIDAERVDVQLRLTLSGGTPCPAGQTGKLVLQTADQPTNVRGTEVLVSFADQPGAPGAGPAPIRRTR